MRPHPFPQETLISYLHRLATANHAPPRTLLEMLRGRSPTAVDISRLAAAAAMPEHALRRALPELTGPQPEVRLGRHGKVIGYPGHTSRPPCRRCVATRGIHDTVTCWSTPSHEVCCTHQMWIGLHVSAPADQIDVSAMPDISRAQRRQRKLQAHFPAMATSYYNDAKWICQLWARQEHHPSPRDRRLAALAPAGNPSPAARHAAIYPEIIAMTDLLSTPRWRTLALSTQPADLQEVYQEIGRRIGARYEPTDSRDPFIRWVRAQHRGTPAAVYYRSHASDTDN